MFSYQFCTQQPRLSFKNRSCNLNSSNELLSNIKLNLNSTVAYMTCHDQSLPYSSNPFFITCFLVHYFTSITLVPLVFLKHSSTSGLGTCFSWNALLQSFMQLDFNPSALFSILSFSETFPGFLTKILSNTPMFSLEFKGS